MLHPKAVDGFLDEERDSFLWMKYLTTAELDDALADQDFRSIHPKPLRKHQKVCVLLCLAYPQFALWLDMGTGKTRIILELLAHWWRTGMVHRAMVLASSDAAVLEWEKQIALWNFPMPYVALGNSPTAEKWQGIAELGAGLILVTYPGFGWMFSSKVVDKKKKKGKLKPDTARVASFAKNLQAMVWDESIHVGNHQSLDWKISKKLSDGCLVRIPMAGVPFNRDPTMVWAQQYLADRGESLGDTLGLFRGAFFDEKKGYWRRFEYKYKKEREPDLRRMMGHRSMTYSADECLDLPPVTSIIRDVFLSDDVEAYYRKAVEALKRARGDKVAINNLFLRMRQLSSGFLGYKDDESGERASLIFKSNPKLDDLAEQIADMPDNRKFLIFHEFNVSGQMICDALKKLKVGHGWIRGGTPNVPELRKRFDNDDPRKFQGLVLNWRKAAESLNLQAANYVHMFESPVSRIMRAQAEKRAFRDGQLHKGFLFDYVAAPVDQRILDFHATGEDLFTALLRDPDKALAGARRQTR